MNLRQKYLNIIFLAIFAIIPIQANAESESCKFVRDYIEKGLPPENLKQEYNLVSNNDRPIFPYSPNEYSLELIQMQKFELDTDYKNKILDYLNTRKMSKIKSFKTKNIFYVIVLDETETQDNQRKFIRSLQIEEFIKEIAIQKCPTKTILVCKQDQLMLRKKL